MITKENSLIVEGLLLRSTIEAAVKIFPSIGKGDRNLSDGLATDALRKVLNDSTLVHSKIVIGEGERDDAPMLFIGEELGNKDSTIKIDIAVDPIEGTNPCVMNEPNSISIICAAEKGSIMHAPDVYMDKISTGIVFDRDKIDLDFSIEDNLKILSTAAKLKKEQLNVVVLNRPRHFDLIERIKRFGSNVILIEDNDVVATMKSMEWNKTNIHLYIGTGGAPEGVISAAIANNYNGFFQGRINVKNSSKDQIERAKKMGVSDFDKKYDSRDLVSKKSIVVATGITNSHLIHGISIYNNTIRTSSIVMNEFFKMISILSSEYKK